GPRSSSSVRSCCASWSASRATRVRPRGSSESIGTRSSGCSRDGSPRRGFENVAPLHHIGASAPLWCSRVQRRRAPALLGTTHRSGGFPPHAHLASDLLVCRGLRRNPHGEGFRNSSNSRRES